MLFVRTLLIALGAACPGIALAQASTTNGYTVAAYVALLSALPGTRDWSSFRALFLPAARFSANGIDQNGASQFYPMDIEGYVDHIDEFTAARSTSDQVGRRSFVHGRSATVLATFQSRLSADGDVIDRGLMSFHLVWHEDAWRIARVLWNSSTEVDPAPAAVLGCHE